MHLLFPHTVNRKKYVQVQSHLIQGEEYVIENTVLQCVSGSQEGAELPEEEWRKLKPFANMARQVHTGSDKPQFVIDRLNITNNADESNPMGIAIFANAIDILKKLDINLILIAMSSCLAGRESLLHRNCCIMWMEPLPSTQKKESL